jgi:hypothetical protein
VGGLTEHDLLFKRAFDRLERHIEDTYGIPVVISDVLDPNTGDFDGASIKLDYANDLDVAVFVLAHLFGHTAQWATNQRQRELGTIYASKAPPLELWEEVKTYERDASRIALQLFHDAGIDELDQWLSDWAEADWAYLENFYRTGEKGDFRRFLKEGGARVLAPMAIPTFTPEKWVSRYSI